MLVDFNEREDTVEDSQVGTETFHKPGGARVDESSYEGPATGDYAERARPRVASHTGPTITGKKSAAASTATCRPTRAVARR